MENDRTSDSLPPSLAFTGERIVPGGTPLPVFREHEMRYLFAGQHVRSQVVIDIASGTGIGTHYLRKAGAQTCVGLDLDFPSLRYAASAYGGCRFARCDAQQLCLADAVADVLVSFETIEHLSNPRQFLLECRRVLRPGGLLICSSPNRKVYRWDGRNPFHVRELTLEEFLSLLQELFSDCQLYSQHEVNYYLHIVERLAVRFLRAIHAAKFAKQMIHSNRGETIAQTEFDADSHYPPAEVKPYTRKRFVKPMYLVLTARKPA